MAKSIKKDTKQVKKADSLDECQEQRDKYLNGWKRAQADFINYKNQEGDRVKELRKFANENIITELFDVLDNVDMVMRSIPDDVKESHQDWLVGLEQTSKQFNELLTKHGVQRVEVEGVEFDPTKHEAVPGGDPDGDSIEEVRAGYIINGRVIRPARVILKKK